MSVCTVGIGAQTPPFPGDSFDAAVSSWSLCTIPDAVAALQELRRVLKPGARLHFVEHGWHLKSRCVAGSGAWKPLQKRIFAGCYLTRSVTDLVNSTGFIIDELDVFYEKGAPKFAAAYSLGVAVSPMNGAYRLDSAGFTITGTRTSRATESASLSRLASSTSFSCRREVPNDARFRIVQNL